MKKSNESMKKVYLGFDVSQKSIEIFATCDNETSRGTAKINNSKESIKDFLSKFHDLGKVCVVMETGTHSAWMSRYVRNLGCEAVVAHARDLQLIYAADQKNDAMDAEKLARLAQFDKRLLHPIEHMDEERQRDLAILKTRDMLVRQKTQITNAIRGILRSFGESDEAMTIDNMKNSYDSLSENIKEIFLPLIQQLNYLELGIKSYDKIIKKLCKKYKVTDILRQVKGVGPEISLAFVLIVGDPRRFPGGNKACAYFGLVPKQDQSGETDKQLSITKRGNKLMRRLLRCKAS